MIAKVAGQSMDIQPIFLDVALSETYRARQWDAYERLIVDVIEGKLTLFMRRDEQAAAWQWVEPIMKAWERSAQPPQSYPAGRSAERRVGKVGVCTCRSRWWTST